MPSPFPGMDPYLESPELWPDVHNKLISEIQDFLNPRLLPKYVARVEARVYVSDESDPGRKVLVPDLRVETARRSRRDTVAKGLAVLEVAEPLEFPMLMEEEIAETYLTIKHRDTNSLVALIEVLSATNKIAGSEGRNSFLRKKREVIASSVHWIEIDLLRDGLRLPAAPPLVASDYRVTVSRGDARRRAKYWPIQLRQRLPMVGIPLKDNDKDVPLSLSAVLESAYDNAAYFASIDYARPPVPPLSPADEKWANQLLKKAKLR